MRISPEIAHFLKTRLRDIDPDVEVYLFGSRVDDTKKGGDIDVLILTEKRIPRSRLREVKQEFYARFGYQQLDLVNYLFDENVPFKSLALLESEQL